MMVSCQDDFLNLTPRTSLSQEEFFKSEEDLQLYSYGLVSWPGKWGTYISGDSGTDNAATTASVEIKNIMTGNPSSENITSGWSWGRLRNINYFLEALENAEVSEEVKEHYKAIGRYYRATFYIGMVKRYSDVPYYDKVLNSTDEDLYKGRDPRSMVVDKIMEDLDFAGENLRETGPTGTVNKYVAIAMKARFALYEGTYRKYHEELALSETANDFLNIAVEASDAMISSGHFQLYQTGSPDQDYKDLFNQESLAGNPEMIAYAEYDFEKGRGENYLYGMNDYERSPSRDLVQAFLMKDGSRFTDISGFQTLQYVEEFDNRDPRMAQILAAPGFIYPGTFTPYVQRLNKNFTGYHVVKGYPTSIEAGVADGLDVPVIRYAEILLILAEAKAELGTLTQADLDNTVNLLRARVGMVSLKMAEANANIDQWLKNKYPQVSGSNTGVLLEIRRERRIEFALEGYRFDDLMRWNAGALLENNPTGMYFPGLGKYDLTGDGVEDIILISSEESIPEGEDKEVNELGVTLVYYKAGDFNEDVTVYLENGDHGQTLTQITERVFTSPRDYYRPIPKQETLLNPNLVQTFGWN